MKPEFDNFADEYNAINDRAAIRATGYPLEYFTNYKVDDICREININRLRPDTFLDFGCGIGNTLKSLSSRALGLKLFGAEVSAASVGIAKGLNLPADIALIDSALPFEERHFGFTFASCVFHHIPESEQQKWADELFLVTDSGGTVMIYEHNPLNPVTRHVFANSPFEANAKNAHPCPLESAVATGWVSRP